MAINTDKKKAYYREHRAELKMLCAAESFFNYHGIPHNEIEITKKKEIGRTLLICGGNRRYIHYLQFYWRKSSKEITELKVELLLRRGLRHCDFCNHDLPIDEFGVIIRQKKNECVTCARIRQNERMRYYYYLNTEEVLGYQRSRKRAIKYGN